MTAVANFLDEVVLTGSSADGPVQAWDVRTGMQLKAYKCVPARRSAVPTGDIFRDGRLGASDPTRTAPFVRRTDPEPSIHLARTHHTSPGPPHADAGDCAG